MTSPGDATRASFERMIAARPLLTGCGPLAAFRSLPPHTLLHAGPPFESGAEIPVPVLNAAAAAALFEGWAAAPAEAEAAIRAGTIGLEPAQNHGVVTPLAFVVSPAMPVLAVTDAVYRTIRLTPVNDGPRPDALRFGNRTDAQQTRLALMRRIAPDLGRALAEPVDMLAVMRAGLADGDDLHGRVAAANAALLALLLPRLAGEAQAYPQSAPQFVLNAIMAACAVMLAAGEGVAGSHLVTGAGGNGVAMGWRIADAPPVWQRRPARVPLGPRFAEATALGAIGDSAVIDACGFGAAALRFAPELAASLKPHHPDFPFDERASGIFLGPHPGFDPNLKLGLDFRGVTPGAGGTMLAALDADGVQGLIGNGIAVWS